MRFKSSLLRGFLRKFCGNLRPAPYTQPPFIVFVRRHGNKCSCKLYLKGKVQLKHFYKKQIL
jgi:hypothetical protein